MTALSDARDLIVKRLAEIGDERGKLERALKVLGRTNGQGGRGKPRGGRSRAPASPVREVNPRRRSRKGGTRSEQALAFIEKNPGSTAIQVADELKIAVNYIYRVLSDLVKEGRVQKHGTAYTVIG